MQLTLMLPSNEGYGAVDPQGRKVEIKTATRSSISWPASGTEAERLLALQLDRDGDATVAYDGLAAPV